MDIYLENLRIIINIILVSTPYAIIYIRNEMLETYSTYLRIPLRHHIKFTFGYCIMLCYVRCRNHFLMINCSAMI